MSASCDASITDWATLVITTISINITWWVLEIPKLRHGKPKNFIDAVAWQCLRMCFPPVAAIYAIVSTPQHKLWPKRYYKGPQIGEEPEHFKALDFLKCAAVDMITIVSVVLSIHHLYKSPGENASGWNSSLWSFPSFPVTVYGLSIQFAAALQLRRRNALILGLLFAVGAGAGIGYAISQSANPSFKFAVILYGIMSTPLILLFPTLQLTLVLLMIITLMRIGGVAVGALTPEAYFPFCALKGPAFAVPYIVFGAVASLLALYGSIIFSEPLLDTVGHFLDTAGDWIPKYILRRPDNETIETDSTAVKLNQQPSPLSRQV